MLHLHRRYGDIVRVNWFGRPSTLVSRPEHVKHVLADRWRCYAKGPFFEVFRPLLGDGLVTNDGEIWRRHRSLLQPLFARDRLDPLVAIAVEEADALVARWQARSRVDLVSEIERLTLAFIIRALFRRDLLARVDEMCALFRIASHEGVRRARTPLRLPAWVPTRHHRAWNRALRGLDALIYEQIRDTRRIGGDHGTLLDRMVAARDEAGEPLGDREIRDELLTFLFAGYETTATALAWTFDYLSRDPALQARLRAEVDAVFDAGPPSASAIGGLRLTQAVLEEAMRLRPPVYAIQRRCTSADEIAGHSIAVGSSVVISAYVTHRRFSPWPDPEVFRPDRWLEGERPDRFAHFPFGAGPRACIGARWTVLEASVVLARTVAAFDLRATAEPPAQRTLTTLQPSSTILLGLEPRGTR